MYKLLNELANDLKLRTLGNFKKILEMSEIKDKSPAGHLKSKLWLVTSQNYKKKPRSKTFHRKAYLINFKNMSTIFCPGLKAFFLTSLKVQYFTHRYSQLKCKNYNVRLNAIIKNAKSKILVDYILYA